jgi:hypothetical protein
MEGKQGNNTVQSFLIKREAEDKQTTSRLKFDQQVN